MDRRSSGEQVAAHIRQLIFDGSLQHGDRIRQDEVAETLGVSRIPVREAIIALDREGWVTIEPHRGAFVQGIDEASVRDHYELIGLMWGLAAKRAVERGDAEALAVLVGLQRDLAASDDVDEFARRNETFVRQLFEMAHSARLVSQLRVMPGIVPGNFFAQVPDAMDTQARGTGWIVKAVRAGDGEKAADAALKLLMRQGDHVVDALAARAFAAAAAS
ncbi:MAG TPA: GntR family transcriptional regulator [Microthrixaceae bacterium]|nr:GntR family transcriptional regulator [Microthrixaceae bacterium]